MAEKRKTPIDPTLLARARAMRHEPAPAEEKLWACLRDRQLGSFKFRRQVPLGSFIADFYCHQVDLIVELDGESHRPRSREDLARTRLLEKQGHRLIRFWNTEVFENLDGVLEAILQKCEQLDHRAPPHPRPLPEGEGESFQRAAEVLQRGGVVAFPTETVYGLGADATNADAVARVFAIKGRPSTNPLICHVADEIVARKYARVWPLAASQIADAFWPGPITIVLPRTDSIVSNVTAGLDTVGLRAPDHPLALELLRAFDGPLAGPSANRSTHVSPTTAQHVRDELGDSVDLILDGGPCRMGIESTVLELSADVPRILRPGAITREMIEDVIKARVETRSELVPSRSSDPMRSPGQMEVHYAPRTPAFRFESDERGQIDLTDAAIVELTLDPETYARNLYARLRMLDTQGLRAIYVEMPPDAPLWAAVRDRVLRATRPLSDER